MKKIPSLNNPNQTDDRNKRQIIAAQRWRQSKAFGASRQGQGCLWIDTGVGKTRIAIDHIINPTIKKRISVSIVVLVHRVALHKQWEERLTKRVNPDHRANISVHTVQDLIANETKLKCDILIVDELHRFYAEKYVEYINGTKIQFKWNLGLTATYKDKGREKVIKDIYPVIDRITRETAIAKGWVSRYVEYNLAVKLNRREAKEHKEACMKLDSNLSKFGNFGLQAAIKVLGGGTDSNSKEWTGIQFATMWAVKQGWTNDSAKDSDANKMWNPRTIIGYAKNVFSAIKERDFVLNHAKKKLIACRDILAKFNTVKAMCFSESTLFADKLGKAYNKHNTDGCVVYHSQITSRPLKENGEYLRYKSGAKKGQIKKFGKVSLKKRYLEDFAGDGARVLATARVLDEGFDNANIRLGIIAARSRSRNQHTQRGGRIVRIIPESPTDVMLIINLYIPETSDEHKLKASQHRAKNKIYWVNKVEDIEFDPSNLVDDEFDIDEL